MTINRIAIGCVAIILSALSSNQAKSETFLCDYCDAPSMEAQSIVMSAHHNLPQFTPIYIVNSKSGIVRKYYVTTPHEIGDVENQIPIEGDQKYGYAVEDPTEPPIINYAYFVHQKSNTEILVPRDQHPGSAWDILNNPSRELLVTNHIRESNAELGTRLASLLSALNPFGGFDPSKISFPVRLIFPDGSSSIFIFDARLKEWKREKGSSRDSNGNILPESLQDFAGGVGSIREYYFGNGNLADFTNFVAAAENHGVYIIGTIGSGKGGMVCTSIIKESENQELRESVICTASN